MNDHEALSRKAVGFSLGKERALQLLDLLLNLESPGSFFHQEFW
jgi:hypothetical protein